MDSLQNILGGKVYKAPDEMAVVKDYVNRRYKSSCSVRLNQDSIVLSVPNSALAGTLRMNQEELIKKCQLKKRLIIRVGK